jgi:hypothetical protein
MKDQSFATRLVTNAVIGGTVSAAAGGNFGNGAVTAAFGYLFNEVALACRPAVSSTMPALHCGLFVFEGSDPRTATIRAQFSLGGGATQFNTNVGVYLEDWEAFRSGSVYISQRPPGMSQQAYDDAVISLAQQYNASNYWALPESGGGPNSNSAAAYAIHVLGGSLPWTGPPGAPGLNYYHYLRPTPLQHQFLK